MWKAAACGSENTLLNFIAQGADVCAWHGAPSSKTSSAEQSSAEEETEEEEEGEEDNSPITVVDL